MKAYMTVLALIPAIVVGTTGAQAKDTCGQRSATVLKVKTWEANGRDGNLHYRVTLASTHRKALTHVGGTIEFVGPAMQRLATIKLVLPEPVSANGEISIAHSEPETDANRRLLAMAGKGVHALACVDSARFDDGSGMTIN